LWQRAWIAMAVALLTGVVGAFMTIGADARWLGALGRVVAHHGIPSGVPFASASTSHWANTLVLAELIFHGLEAGIGDRGLILANLLAVGLALSILARDAEMGGARAISIAGMLGLAVLGALPSLAVARVQLFSLVLFPALLLLLRSEERTPSKRIWLALPLLAVWSNLHGAVLAGLGLLLAYLVFERLRRDPATAVAVGVLAFPALCVTPAGVRTVDYFRGLLSNVAEQRGLGQWAPLGHSPFDWVLVAVAVLMAARLWRRRPPLWELAVMLGLAVLTVKASRDGVWLLFVLVGPAARAARRQGQDWNGFVPLGLVLAFALLVFDVAHTPHRAGASQSAVAEAIRLAHGTPILADGLPAEQVALAGGRIWAGNPLDAFSRAVQTEYVDWLAGQSTAHGALNASAVRIVLVTRGSDADAITARDPQFEPVAGDSSAVVYLRSARAG
jgi:hypothetical protein